MLFRSAEIAPYFDLWTIQTYWTNRSTESGWRDGYRYVIENVRRLRAVTGRADLPIHVTGGVNEKVKVILNDVSGFQQAAREMGVVGVSFYDWLTWPSNWWPYSWSFRKAAKDAAKTGVADRFIPVEPPPYVPIPQPPIIVPSTVVSVVVSVTTSSVP